MKICIVGAGAIGATLGVSLAQSGQMVSVLARGQTLAAVRAQGLGVVQGEQTTRVKVAVSDQAAELGTQDLVVVAVKGPAMAAVAESIAPLLGPDTQVITAMNGLPWWFLDGLPHGMTDTVLRSVDPQGRLRALLPPRQVMGAVLHMACSQVEPGLVRWNFGKGIIIGHALGGQSPSLDAAVAAFAKAGFDASASACVQQDIWYKLWGNMTMNPVSAITGATADRMLGHPRVRAFCSAIMTEAAALGARIGCPIAQAPEERHAVTAKLGAFKTSMLQDVEQGRTLEIDALLTVVLEIADRLGHPMPNASALLGLVELMAESRGLR